MRLLWEVDDRTRVEATIGLFGRQVVSINGVEVLKRRKFDLRGVTALVLPDGRDATLAVKSALSGRFRVELRVGGDL